MKLVCQFLLLTKRFVGWTVAGMLGWMVLLALLQLLMRWTISKGLPWADIQLRQLVLWLGLLGGILAAAENRHIRIDLVEHYFSDHFRRIIGKLVSLFASFTSVFLGFLSLSFISNEKSASVMLDKMFFGASIPIWIPELIIPISFWLMGIYFIFPVRRISAYLEEKDRH